MRIDRALRRARRAGVGLFLVAAAACATAAPPPAPAQSDLVRLHAEWESGGRDATTGVTLARGFRAVGRYDRALSVLEEISTGSPGDPSVGLLLGLTYEDLGQPEEALRVYAAIDASGHLAEEIEARREVVQRRLVRERIAHTLLRERSLADRPAQEMSVAVFPFDYEGGDPRLDPLGWAIGSMLTTDLSQTGRLQVLDRVSVQTFLDEIELGASGRVDPATAARGGMILGARHVVRGTIAGTTDTPVRVQAAVGISGRSPATPRKVEDESRLDEIFDLEKRLAFGIYAALGIELTAAERDRVSQRWTDSMDALLAYGHGLEAEAFGRLDEAAQRFREAAALDPAFDEAVRAAATAEGVARSSALSTVEIEASVDESPADEFDAQEMLDAMDALVPTGDARDPMAEILGWDLGQPALNIVILRPGGG
ncbi:MAG: tetratricopeptide repeat protein [Gemmatimonadetes bacterium]|nr:tetratricopeptide repeat protein [Gemmatimonadota bacterium]